MEAKSIWSFLFEVLEAEVVKGTPLLILFEDEGPLSDRFVRLISLKVSLPEGVSL